MLFTIIRLTFLVFCGLDWRYPATSGANRHFLVTTLKSLAKEATA